MRTAGTLHRSSPHTGRWAIAALAGAILAVAGFAAVRAQLSTSARAAAGATFTVTSDADTDDGTCDAQCTLREAIHAANGNNNPNDTDTIAFNIPGAGVHTISPGTGGFGALPPIVEPVVIDGSTQPTASCDPRNLLIQLQGSSISGGGDGFNVVAGNSTIRGFAIGGFAHGVRLQTSGGNTVECNHIGTDPAGLAAIPNFQGIGVYSANNTIGGNSAATRNVLSGNAAYGIYFTTLGQGHHNTIVGNFIGTDATGNAPVSNPPACSGAACSGIFVGSSDNVIGGTAPGEGNLISGNGLHGVALVGVGATRTSIIGNRIGTNAAGTAAVPNTSNGIFVNFGANDNVFGGTVPGSGNLISGNGGSGIVITGQGATGNQVLGNYIGTNATGLSPVPNQIYGVSVQFGGDNTVIGGNTPAHRNVISGNGGGFFGRSGVQVDSASNVHVKGNFIGLGADGTTVVANELDGVNVGNGATNTVIGGTAAGEGNVVSGNGENGIVVFAAFSGQNSALQTQIQGNLIGTDASGGLARGNGSVGLYLSNSNGTTIGGAAPGAGNVISGNDDTGIWIVGQSATANHVSGNFIGTNASGTAAIPNNADGVLIWDAPQNTIGGSAPGAGNVISGNGDKGVWILGQYATANQVVGNFIGTNASGTAGIPNTYYGVSVDGAPQNTVGGTAPGEGNLISGNGSSGVRIVGPLATGNEVLGNHIGTDATGTAAIPNLHQGVQVEDAPDNTIGGTTPGEGNLISGNGLGGVSIVGATALNNAIVNNSFYANGGLAIDLGGDGPTANDPLDADAGPNDLLNAPTLTTGVSDGTTTTIAGQLSATPNSGFFVSVYTNAVCDPGGFGEGENHVWFMLVGTDANGLADLAFDLPLAVPPGQALTALTHAQVGPNTLGSTSEFSNCIPVTGAPLIPVEAGANGTVWTGDAGTLPGSFLTARAVTPLPDEVSAVFHWNNDDQRFDFWFRGFPSAFNTLGGLDPGGYYFFQANGATTVNVPGFGTFTVPSPGGQFTTFSGATGWLWSGTNRPLSILATLPDGVSAIFAWNNGAQRFDFWFRGFPGPFQTLTAGIQRGGYYFFQSPGGTVVPLD